MRLTGHVVKRPDDSNKKNVWQTGNIGLRPRERHTNRWKDQVHGDMNKVNMTEDDPEDPKRRGMRALNWWGF